MRRPGRVAMWKKTMVATMCIVVHSEDSRRTVREWGRSFSQLFFAQHSLTWWYFTSSRWPKSILASSSLKIIWFDAWNMILESMNWKDIFLFFLLLLSSALCIWVSMCACMRWCIRVKHGGERDVMQFLTSSSFAVSSEGSSILWRFCGRINHKGRRPPESSFQCWDAEGPQPLPPCHGKAAGNTGHFIRGPRSGVWWGGMTSAGKHHLLTSGNKICWSVLLPCLISSSSCNSLLSPAPSLIGVGEEEAKPSAFIYNFF